MFRKSGLQRFDLCPHKVPVLSEKKGELECPRTKETGIVVEVHPGAHVDIANVDISTKEEWMYNSRVHGMNELAAAAAALICGPCPYYKLLPTEAASQIAQNAEAQAKIDEALTEQAQASAKLAEANARLLAARNSEMSEQVTYDGLRRFLDATAADAPHEESPGT